MVRFPFAPITSLCVLLGLKLLTTNSSSGEASGEVTRPACIPILARPLNWYRCPHRKPSGKSHLHHRQASGRPGCRSGCSFAALHSDSWHPDHRGRPVRVDAGIRSCRIACHLAEHSEPWTQSGQQAQSAQLASGQEFAAKHSRGESCLAGWSEAGKPRLLPEWM